MTYAVEWTAAALGQLAALWNRSADRTAVTVASHQLDTELTGLVSLAIRR